MVTIDKQVASSTYDGYWIDLYKVFGNAEQYQILGNYGGSRSNVFACWTSVIIPVGAIITTAYVQWRFHSYSGSPPECTLYFNDAKPAVVPSTDTDAEALVKTTANVKYTPPIKGDWLTSPELKTIIQELVDSYDYSSGSSMELLGIGSTSDGTNNGYTAFRTYNYATGDAPKLHIEYSLPSLLSKRRSFNSLLVR